MLILTDILPTRQLVNLSTNNKPYMKKVLFLLLTALMLSGQWSTANAQGAIATNNNRVIVPITSGRNIPYVAFTGNLRVEATADY